MNLVKSEFLKFLWLRRNWGLLLAATAISSLGAAFSPYAIVRVGGSLAMPLSSPDVVDGLYAKAMGGYMFMLILGIYAMSSEFHQHTAIATFLATPKRWKALVAKLGVSAVVGAVFNVIATGISMIAAAIALGFYKDAAAPHDYIFADYFASSALTGAVLAVMGVGIGTLIRSQNAAVLTGTLWIFLVDRLLAVLFVEVGKYLPTGLITSLMNLKLNLNSKQIPITLSTADYLDPAPAAGLLLLYGVVFAAVAVFTTLRRDID